MAARIERREDLEKWLRGRSREAAVAIAARAALRVLPKLVMFLEYRGPRRLADLTLATVRATALARVATVYPARASDLRTAADAAGGAAYAFVTAYPAASAADAAFAIFNDIDGSHDHAHAAVTAAAAGDAMWSQVDADARVLDSGSARSLMRLTLWVGPEPDWAADAWVQLKAGLHEQDRWGFWIAWYEAILAGRPLWPELDATAREELEVRICLIDDGLWAEGPAIVNAEIERLIAEAMPARGAELQPLENLPSAFAYGWNAAARIAVIAGPQSMPWLPHATSEADHSAYLHACHTLALRLANDLQNLKFHNVRPDYKDALEHYLGDLPAAPERGNLVLADNEMRSLRALFAAEVVDLPKPFAARLRTLLEQHMALRPFYPEIERLYDAAARGRLAVPLPLDHIAKLESAIVAATPTIVEPEVPAGLRELQRTALTLALPPETSIAAEGVVYPPPDPIQAPSPQRTRDFERASALNSFAAVVKNGAELGKGFQGWSALYGAVTEHAPAIIEWLHRLL